jgi:hypothetical protein
MGGRAAAQRAASEGHAGEERTARHDHSEKVPSKFFLLYHFFYHIIYISFPTFSFSATVPSKYSLYTHYNHKISFSIPTFYPLSIFHLLTIHWGPQLQYQTVLGRVNSDMPELEGERRAPLTRGYVEANDAG